MGKAIKYGITTGLAIFLLGGLITGCCEHAGALKSAMSAMSTVQAVYGPLVSGYLSDQANGTVKAGMVAADTLLALGGQIQAAKCATPEQAAQMELQAAQIERAAAAAGVK